MSRLIYSEDRSVVFHGPAGVTESLGTASANTSDRDVLDWMVGFAAPFDTITTPKGTFAVLAPKSDLASMSFFGQPPAMRFRS